MHRLRLCQRQLEATSAALLGADQDSNPTDINKSIESLWDVLMQWRSLQVALALAERDLEWIESAIKILQANAQRAYR